MFGRAYILLISKGHLESLAGLVVSGVGGQNLATMNLGPAIIKRGDSKRAPAIVVFDTIGPRIRKQLSNKLTAKDLRTQSRHGVC
jgi:hypothetical protein